MIIGNDIVLNVEDFLGAMINSYLLFAPYADLSYDEIAQLLEEYFCDYIAQYGIVILKPVSYTHLTLPTKLEV